MENPQAAVDDPKYASRSANGLQESLLGAQEGDSEEVKSAERTFKRRASVLLVCLLLNAGIVMACLFSFVTPLVPAGVLAFTFGLRHAVDADHIACIDNVTRRLSTNKNRPISIGFMFSLGHSTVVFLMCVFVSAGSQYAREHMKDAENIGAVLGTVISAAVLLIVGLLNLRTAYYLHQDWKNGRACSGHKHELAGVFMRCCPRLFGNIRHPFQMYLVGFLFGLGFDTASQVALLALAGSAHPGVPQYAVLILPLAFASGMTLIDTANGVFMAWAYGWALMDPARKLFYNLFLTLTSSMVALAIGMVEALGVVAIELNLQGPFWKWIASVNNHFEAVGYGVIGIFVISLVIAMIEYKRTFSKN